MRRAIIIGAVIAVTIGCGGTASQPTSSKTVTLSSTSASPTAVSMPDASLLVLTADEFGPTFSLLTEAGEGPWYAAIYWNNDRSAYTETLRVQSLVHTQYVEEGEEYDPRTGFYTEMDSQDSVLLIVRVENNWDEILDIEQVDLGPMAVPYVAYRSEVRIGELLFMAYLVEMGRGRVRAALRVEASNDPGLGGVSLAQLTTNTRRFAERQAEKLIRLLPGE